MSRLTSLKFASTLLLLLGLLSSHQAMADTDPYAGDPTACEAGTLAAFQACVNLLEDKTSPITQLVITDQIECSDFKACYIVFDGGPITPTGAGTGKASVSIIGYPIAPATVAELHRTANYDYTLISIVNSPKVTLRDFTIYDDPAPANPNMVDGTVYVYDSTNAVNLQYLAVFCGTPRAPGNSTVSNPSVQGTPIAGTDVGVSCPKSSYVTVIEPIRQSDGTYQFEYADVNGECFQKTNPRHLCVDDVDVESSTNLLISGVTVNHSQGDAIDFGNITGFIFQNNHINNSFFRGLTGSGTDVSIENNYFFANRAAALRVNITSSSGRQPSDVYNNTFNHNQHGDAFPCNQSEGCSGGQLGITGSDFIFYGNTFLNGFDDFYDPQVFELPFGYDAFSDCDLSAQCDYQAIPIYLGGYGSAGSPSGSLWLNGGGVETGPNDNGPQDGTHETPDVEIDAPVGNNVIFSNNAFDYGSYAMSYDDPPNTTTDPIGVYNNEMFENSQNSPDYRSTEYFHFGNMVHNDSNNCQSSPNCGSVNVVTPVILEEGPTTATAERNDCGATNCLWVTTTEDWSPVYNSLALGSSGSTIQCALQIYGPGGGTLLATVKGDGNATCISDEGVFTIPASVAQHQTSVQIAFENLSTGLSSAKQLVTLAGMTPTITGTGLGCTGDTCIWITATDTSTDCAVGLYNPTTLASIMTLSDSQVNCNKAGEVTFVIPTSIQNNYSSIVVNYQNLTQGTWSKLATVTLSTGTGGGGGGGGISCGSGTTCQKQ